VHVIKKNGAGGGAILQAPIVLFCVCFALFVTYLVHNGDATVSCDRKELLDIRTVITHLELDEDFSLMSLVTIYQPVDNPPLTFVLLANMQSLKNKLGELRLRLSYQQDVKNCNILCFTKVFCASAGQNSCVRPVRRGWGYVSICK
jgi:hypothetical protein